MGCGASSSNQQLTDADKSKQQQQQQGNNSSQLDDTATTKHDVLVDDVEDDDDPLVLSDDEDINVVERDLMKQQNNPNNNSNRPLANKDVNSASASTNSVTAKKPNAAKELSNTFDIGSDSEDDDEPPRTLADAVRRQGSIRARPIRKSSNVAAAVASSAPGGRGTSSMRPGKFAASPLSKASASPSRVAKLGVVGAKGATQIGSMEQYEGKR